MAIKPTYEELEQRVKELEGKRSGHLELDLAALFQGFEDSFPVGITDHKGVVLYVNNALMEMWGYSSPEDIIGRQLAEFWEGPGIYSTMEDLASKGWSMGEDIGKRKDSSLFPVEYKAIMCNNIDGKPLYMLGQFFDISEQKRAEAALKKSDQKYKTLMESICDGVYILDKKGRFTFVNDVIVRRSKQTREWFLGKSYLDVIRPEDRVHVRKKFEATMRGEDVPVYELAYPTASRDELWVEVNTTTLRTDTGIIGLLGISRDISDRKLAGKRLEKARIELENRVEERTAELTKTTEQLNTLMNATTDTIFLIDLKGYVVAANAVTAERFGMRLEQFIGTCTYDFMLPSLARSRKAIANRVVKTRKPHRFEDVRKGIVFDSTVYPVFDDRGKVAQLAIYGKDITERKRSEQALKRAEEALRIKTKSLEEMNTALKILLNSKDEDQREFEERILANVKHLVLPYFGKMRKHLTNEKLKAHLDILETNLSNIISPFSQKLSSKYIYLTTTEIEVANLVKEGGSSKDIAEMLGTSYKTIQNHRVNIRRKLRITKKPISLRTYLSSLQ